MKGARHSSCKRGSRWPIVACVVLVALPFLLFWRVWWPDPRQRRVFTHGDFPLQYYPMRVFVAGELRQGHLPLWDPFTYGGEPAIAESLFASFYPPGFWQAVFPGRLPFVALELEAVAHLGLAGLFTFLLVRRLTSRTGAALVAGMALSLGGLLTSYPMLQLAILETAAWLPAGLWLLEVALARRSLWGVSLAGLVFGIAILAGHPQTFMYMAYLAGAYLVFRCFRLGLGWRFTVSSGLVLGGAALGLGAIQWLPSLEMLPASARGSLSYEMVSNGFSASELLGLLRPNPGQWSPLYVGLVPLGLALAGAVLWRRGEAWFWAAVAVVALLLSMGRHGPLYPVAYAVAPGFARFRSQERIALLVSFALAVLAGYGYAALAQRFRRPWLILPLLSALVVVDLFLANSGVILQTPPPGGYYPPSPAAQYLQGTGDRVGRVSTEGLLPADGNAGLLYGIRDVTGNGPLALTHYQTFLDTVPGMRWSQMLNVQYVLTTRRIDHGAFKLVLEQGDQRLYQLYIGQRAAWIAHDAQAVDGLDAALKLTAEMPEDPLQRAVLEQTPDPLPAPATGPEEATVTGFDRQWVAVDAKLTAPGILVLSEIAYPGWVALVDGRPVASLRAYGLLRAVALPAGHWRLEWRFEPITFRAGALVSLLTLLAVSLACLWRRAAHRSAPAALRAVGEGARPQAGGAL